MKKQVLGFATISQYVNNTPGITAPVGELSTLARTYSKEKGEYVNNTIPGYRITTFSCLDAATQTPVVLAGNEATQAINVIRACVAYVGSHSRPLDPEDFHASIQAEFYGVIKDLVFGDLETQGANPMPTIISWTSAVDDESTFQIWTSNAAFEDQYPGFNITVVPPLTDPSLLLGGWQTAVDLINARPVDAMITDAEAARGVNPYTFLRTFRFTFVNRSNPTQFVYTNWAALVYGKAGDDIDSIKDAIVEYLVTETSRPESDWELVLPDLFKRTEFIVWPRWDKKSTTNMSPETALYSSLLDPAECIDFAEAATTFYLDTFVRQNVNTMPVTFKAVSLVVVNGQNNVLGKKLLKELIPDYLPVASTSPDFQRMSETTKAWVNFMLPLVIAAEKASGISQLPVGMRRVRRDGKLFVGAMHNEINYLVAARSNTAVYN